VQVSENHFCEGPSGLYRTVQPASSIRESEMYGMSRYKLALVSFQWNDLVVRLAPFASWQTLEQSISRCCEMHDPGVRIEVGEQISPSWLKQRRLGDDDEIPWQPQLLMSDLHIMGPQTGVFLTAEVAEYIEGLPIFLFSFLFYHASQLVRRIEQCDLLVKVRGRDCVEEGIRVSVAEHRKESL
jgi:hypothetical protein